MQSLAPRTRHRVVASERVGLYTLVRIERGEADPGIPGQFFMLEAPGRLLPRPFSVCLAPPGELAFLVDVVGPGTEAIAALEPGDEIAVFGPLGNGYRLDVERPLLVGGGIGIAPLPYLAEQLATIGRRTAHRRRLPERGARSRRVTPARRRDRHRSRPRHLARRSGHGRPRVRAGAHAPRGSDDCPARPARVGGADGVRLRRVLRLRRRDRRRAQASLH